MLELKSQCQVCEAPLAQDAGGAYICSFECTFCAACATGELDQSCPNCEDPLVPRPVRRKAPPQDLLVSRKGAVATLTLNRPAARNAYSEAMIRDFCAALDELGNDDQIRVVALRGAGSSFCAGGDLKAMRDRSGMFAGNPLELRQRYHAGIQGMSRRIATFEKPLVAVVQGPAIGAGLDLACMCDIRLASKSARFGSTFVKVGLIPGDGGALFLSRVIGFPRALEMILSARILDAQEAKEIGLVHQLCEDDQLDELAERYLLALAENPPGAVQMAKRLCYQSAPDRDIEGALLHAAAVQAMVQHHPDHEKAVLKLLNRKR